MKSISVRKLIIENPALFIPGTICVLVFGALQIAVIEPPNYIPFLDQTFWIVLAIHFVLSALTLTYLTGVVGRLCSERNAAFQPERRLFSDVGKVLAIWVSFLLILCMLFAALAAFLYARSPSRQVESDSIGLIMILLIAVATGVFSCSAYVLPAIVIGRINIVQAFVLSVRTAFQYYAATLRICSTCFGYLIAFTLALIALYNGVLTLWGIKWPPALTMMLMQLWFLPVSVYFPVAVVSVYVEAYGLPKDGNA